MQNKRTDHSGADSEGALTEKDFQIFLQARTYEEQLSVLAAHSKRNQKDILIRRTKIMNETGKTQEQAEQEMAELNRQFGEFLHTKGISAKFRLAFSDMSESAAKQHEADRANFQAVKAQSAEDNKEFVEFLHTKGIKAKFHLVIENIKSGAKNAPANTAAQISKANAAAQAQIPHVSVTYGSAKEISAEDLAAEFNAFLKEKGLSDRYTVEIVEE